MQVIKNINLYLVKNHPIIWNTRFVWMMVVIFALHIISILTGLLATDAKSLTYSSGIPRIYFSGIFQIQLIIAVLALVFWIIAYFRNNALKSMYPYTYWNIVKEFILQFIIFFGLISFYVPVEIGRDLHIRHNYNPKEVAEDIHLINKAMAFIPTSANDYEIYNRAYPKLYDSLIFSTTRDNDTTIVFKLNTINLDDDDLEAFRNHTSYSGNEPTSVVIANEVEDKEAKSKRLAICGVALDDDDYRVFTDQNNLLVYRTLYKQELDTRNSFRNYNILSVQIFYEQYPELLSDIGIKELPPTLRYRNNDFSKVLQTRSGLNKWVIKFMDRNDPREFDGLMQSCIDVLNKYEIGNNLDLVTLRNIYTDNFQTVSQLTHNYPNAMNKNIAPNHRYGNSTETEMIENVYIREIELNHFASNLYDAFFTYIIPIGTFTTFLYFALSLAVFVLIIRVYSHKTVLFALVSAALIIIFISLVSIASDGDLRRLISIVVCLGLVVCGCLPLRNYNKLKRGVVQILSLTAFPFMLLFIEQYIYSALYYRSELTYQRIPLSLHLLLWLAYIIMFLSKIRKWRASPGGK